MTDLLPGVPGHTRPLDAPTRPARAQEIRLHRIQSAPRHRRLHRHLRWRWDVTNYLPTDPTYPAVWDGRLHLGGECGYTFTKLGALIALSRHLNR